MAHGGLRTVAAALGAAWLAIGAAGPSAAAPVGRQFVAISDHNPQAFLRAVRAGSDFAKAGRGNQFRIILSAAGAIMAIPGSSYVQRDVLKLRAGGLQIIVCKETMDVIRKANKRAIPVLPGTSVMSCQGLRGKMMVGGWQPAPGI